MPRVAGWLMSQAGGDAGARSPDLLQGQTRQKIRLDLLQRHTLRLRNEDREENDEEYVQRAIKEKRIAVAEPGEEQQERHTHDGVSDPVCRGAECHSKVAARKWVNFRAKHPNDRPGAHSKTYNEDE
jgi:hypothetical protein